MTDRDVPWTILGVGGAMSLCCLGSAAVGGAALTSGAVAGGLGAEVFQVLVTVATVGVLGLGWRRFQRDGDGECERR